MKTNKLNYLNDELFRINDEQLNINKKGHF